MDCEDFDGADLYCLLLRNPDDLLPSEFERVVKEYKHLMVCKLCWEQFGLILESMLAQANPSRIASYFNNITCLESYIK